MTEELIKKGFNAGYLIEKHLPELAAQISKGFKDASHPFAEGFLKGAEEMTIERSRDEPKFLDRLMDGLGKHDHSGETRGKEDMDMDLDR